MRILLFCLDFKPMIGGVAELTHNLALALLEAGNDVCVISIPMIGAAEFDSTQPYPIFRRALDPPRQGVSRTMALALLVRTEIVSQRPDHVLSNQYDRLSPIVFMVSKFARVSYSIFVHGLDIGHVCSSRRRRRLSRVLRGARAVFVNSRYTREVAVRRGARPERVWIVAPGARPIRKNQRRSNYAASRLHATLASRSDIILSIGRLVPRKGFDTVITALPIIAERRPHVHYVIVGDGPDRCRLQQVAQETGVEERVTFAGRVDDCDKIAFLDACAVFALPNRDAPNGDVEGFGIVFLEANLRKKPVIGGRAGGVPDAIEDRKSGILVEPGNSRSFAEAAVTILEDEMLARRLGEYGRRRAENHFTWENCAKEVVNGLSADGSTGRFNRVQ